MQDAIPYRSARGWIPMSPSSSSASSSSSSLGGVTVRRMVAENPVVVVGRRGCCMVDVARRLLLGLGVNPVVREIGEDAAAVEEAAALMEAVAEVGGAGGDRPRSPKLPVVFVGGRLLGGLDRLVTAHITGDLVPILKDAGALWL
ncbi:unnamed protein product [Musa textilis]